MIPRLFEEEGSAVDVIGGVLDIATGLSVFMGPQAGLAIGGISAIFTMFSGGGGGDPTAKLIQDGFAEQKEFIADQFEVQREFTIELMMGVTEAITESVNAAANYTASVCIKTGEETIDRLNEIEDNNNWRFRQNLATGTQLEFDRLKYKALGLIDALEVRFDFIYSFSGVDKCLDDPMAAEITKRVEYFMDQADVFHIKNTFSFSCMNVLFTQKMTSGHLDTCFFLLYTYMIIEQKRHEILLMMMNLLSNSKNVNQLNAGYLSIQKMQKEETYVWLNKTFDQESYCALFHTGNPKYSDTVHGQEIKLTFQFFGFPATQMEVYCRKYRKCDSDIFLCQSNKNAIFAQKCPESSRGGTNIMINDGLITKRYD